LNKLFQSKFMFTILLVLSTMGILLVNIRNCFKNIGLNKGSLIHTAMGKGIMFFLIFIIASSIAILIFLYKQKNDKNIIVKGFISIAMILGMCILFVNPPFQVPDEVAHFFKAYEVSLGRPVSMGSEHGNGYYVPKSFMKLYSDSKVEELIKGKDRLNVSDIKDSWNVNLDSDDKFFASYDNVATYMPLQYIPQSIGILIGRIFNLGPLVLFYLARLMNFLTYIILAAVAIKLIPVGKEILFLIALMPQNISEVASCAPDALINSLCMVFIALCLYYYKRDKKLSKKEMALLLIIVMCVSSFKVVYFPLALLTFLLKDKFESKKFAYSYLCATLFLSILINLIWIPYSSAEIGTNFANNMGKSGIDVGAQVKQAITNPIKYMYILFSTIESNFSFYINSTIGIIGWLNMPMPQYIIITFMFLMFISTIIENDIEIKVNQKIRYIFIVVFLMIILLIFSSLYAIWTPVGADIIEGVQGRYFIPIIALLLLSFKTDRLKINVNKFNLYMIGFVLFSCIIIITSIVGKYYVIA